MNRFIAPLALAALAVLAGAQAASAMTIEKIVSPAGIEAWLVREQATPLVALNFEKQRFEADFRFTLVRVRENSEQIALLDGERKIMVAALRYLDTFTKVDGTWLFAERQLILDWSETRPSQL